MKNELKCVLICKHIHIKNLIPLFTSLNLPYSKVKSDKFKRVTGHQEGSEQSGWGHSSLEASVRRVSRPSPHLQFLGARDSACRSKDEAPPQGNGRRMTAGTPPRPASWEQGLGLSQDTHLLALGPKSRELRHHTLHLGTMRTPQGPGQESRRQCLG